MKLLLYCTKVKPYLNDYRLMENCNQFVVMNKPYNNLNGKIVAECDFEVEKIEYKHIKERDKFGILHNEAWYEYKGLNITSEDCDLLSKSNLTDDEIWDYLINKDGYAIHIKNLHIFDEPKELSDYIYFRTKLFGTLGNAPQNMMYVYDNEEKKVLISIRPEWLCKILNGEKTIEVRKKVLKEMKKCC